MTLTATVTAQSGSIAPSGTVTFTDGGTSLGAATLAASGALASTATLTTTFGAGTHALVATYGSNFDFANSTIFNASSANASLTVASAVTKHPTAVALTANPTSVQTGQSASLTAKVTATDGDTAIPSGSVAFYDNSQLLATVALDGSGAAVLSSNGFVTGANAITATYSGDTTHTTGTSSAVSISATAPPTLHPTSVTLTANPTTVQAGQADTFAATVAATDGYGATPTGNVQFYDNNLPIGNSVALNGSGVASLTWSGFTAGTHVVAAKYQGDSTFDHSTSSAASVTVNAAPTAVATTITASISPNPISSNGSATLTAHVQQVGSTVTPPQGSIVTFRNAADGSLIAQAALDASGNGTVVKSGWQAGSYTIVATYVGDAQNNPSSGSFSVTVRQSNLVAVAAPSPTLEYGAALPTLTPTYNGLTNGDTASSLATQATCTTTAPASPPPGTYPITCSGASDPYYTFTYVKGTLTVTKAPLTVTPDAVSMRVGDPLPPLTATATGFANSETLATSDVTGSASCTTTATAASPVGTYPITCSIGTLHSNDYAFTIVGPGTLTVLPASGVPTVVTANVGGPFPIGEPVRLTGSLFAGRTPLPNQTLTLSLGSAHCTDTTDSFGYAHCIVTPAGPLGPVASTASFAGNGAYLPSTDSNNALLYADAPGGGSFVVGDVSAGQGGTVTFWGSQWAKDNELSGGDAPKQFKGFASSPAKPKIGESWSTGPGDSPSPPDGPLPAYMAVIVTSSADSSDSSISGNTTNIVIVETNSGYSSNPGSAGTGTIVGALHQLDHPVLTPTVKSHNSDDSGLVDGSGSQMWVPRQRTEHGHARAE